MKYFLLSHTNSKTISICLNRLKQFDIIPNVIYGYEPKRNNIKKNHIVFLNLLDKILNNIDEDFVFMEDDTYINENIINYCNSDRDFVWIANQWVRKSYICGCNIFYVNKNFIETLKNKMKLTRPQHLDRFLFLHIVKNYNCEVIDNFKWMEIPHPSLNNKNNIRNHRKLLNKY